MRKIKKYSILFILTLVFFSCTKEEDNNDSELIDIIGEWNCHDNKSANGLYGERNFLIDISKTDSNYVISNYASLGIDVTAYFNKSSNNFTVEQQDVDGFQTHGTGTFSSDYKTASFTYYLDDEQIVSEWSRN